MTSALFSPIRLAGLELSNRVVVAPMCQYSADDGVGNDWHMTHLGMLANSGAGMLVIEATHVERRGRITHGCLGLYSDACETALERVVYHCHHIGTAKIAIQLAHAGRKASSARPWEGAKALTAEEDAWPTIGPSALPFGPGWHTPAAMTEDDMARVTAAFTDAAKRSLRIGFDAIELHFAHGYLLHSFVSPLSNKRNDAYGGSFEGRMRFPLEVVRSVRAAVPRTVPLGARITGTEWLDNGLNGDDAVEHDGVQRRAVVRRDVADAVVRRPLHDGEISCVEARQHARAVRRDVGGSPAEIRGPEQDTYGYERADQHDPHRRPQEAHGSHRPGCSRAG